MSRELRDPRKKSFQLFYSSTADLLDNFDDHEVGQIFRAIADYEMYGAVPHFEDRGMNLITSRFIQELDRFFDQFEKTCERNRKNSFCKINKKTQSHPLGTTGNDKDEEEVEEKEEVEDNENARVSTLNRNRANGNNLSAGSVNRTGVRKNSRIEELSADAKIYAEEFDRRFNSQEPIDFGD